MQMEFEKTETFTPSGGPDIVCRHLGRGERLFVFHGGSGSYRHWIRNLAALAKHFALCIPDLPGFGDSGDVDPEISLDTSTWTWYSRPWRRMSPPARGFTWWDFPMAA